MIESEKESLADLRIDKYYIVSDLKSIVVEP